MAPPMNRRSFLSTSLAAAAAPLIAPALIRSVHAAAPPGSAVTNEKIDADRAAALDVLKPSRKDLEHGLELHANSVVFDTYGFGPAAAVDNAALARIINSGASDQEITDAR